MKRLRKRLRKEVGHGGVVPRGWRLAWYEPRRRVGIYYPVPLHWLARAAVECVYRLRLALSAPRIERADLLSMQLAHRERQQLADEYSRGYMAGWRECYQTCVDVIESEISQAQATWDVGTLLTGGTNPRRSN
jgi:hypothetical protein